MSGGDVVVETHHLARTFGHLVAVKDVSLSITRGEIFGVLGPNGAGKSTTIRMLCGILDPTSGEGRVVGFDIRHESEQIKQHIGYMTQRFSLYEDLTVQENLDFYAGIYGVPRRTRKHRVAEVLAATGLVARRKQLAGTLSGGWKQLVALASATIHEPPLLFRGSLLDVGTPDEIVLRRNLRIAELAVPTGPDAVRAAAALRKHAEVDEVAHYGHLLRVATRGGIDPEAFAAAVLAAAGIAIDKSRPARTTVEDAFVSMVRADESRHVAAASASA